MKKNKLFRKTKKIFWGIVALLILLGSILILVDNSKQKNLGKQTKNEVQTSKQIPTPLAYNPAISTYPDPTIDKDWKLYTNKIVGYTIAVPANWKAEIYTDLSLLDHQDYVSNFSFYPYGNDMHIADPNYASFSIPFPFSIQGPHKDIGKQYKNGLKGLELSSNWAKSAEYITNNYSSIEGRKTLIVESRSTKTAPPNVYEWCIQCSTKYVYIDLGNGKILTIEAHWGYNRSDFESLFDKAVSTIHFTNDN